MLHVLAMIGMLICGYNAATCWGERPRSYGGFTLYLVLGIVLALANAIKAPL